MKRIALIAAIFPTLIACGFAQTKDVPLVSEVQAPIIANGKQVGSIKLPIGSLVTIVSIQSDGVMVSRGGGSPFKVPKEVIAPQSLALAITPSPTSAPVSGASPLPHQNASPASSTSPQAELPSPFKDGWNSNIQFEKLSAPAKKPSWFSYNFDPTKEKFCIYIPKNYNPKRPPGILAWTNPQDGFWIPLKFQPLFDEFNLIAVAAEGCGNKQPSERRVGLLVSAILELSQKFSVDRSRLLLSGFSGGGRVSALGCFVHPEIFCGAICWCGGNFYKDCPDSQKKGYYWYGFAHDNPDRVTSEDVRKAKDDVRFVLLTGPKDSNYVDSHDIETAMKQEDFHVKLIEEPGLAHAIGSADTMRQGLEFVLGNPPPKSL